jgi:hypothetical protein
MQRVGRDEPLPDEMQGNWIDADDPASELIVDGGEITCFGEAVAYDYKEIGIEDGAITVSLMVDDPAKQDAFQRANVTGLVITAEGAFHAYNVKFASQYVRPATENGSWLGSLRGQIWIAPDAFDRDETLIRQMEEGDIFPSSKTEP